MTPTALLCDAAAASCERGRETSLAYAHLPRPISVRRGPAPRAREAHYLPLTLINVTRVAAAAAGQLGGARERIHAKLAHNTQRRERQRRRLLVGELQRRRPS